MIARCNGLNCESKYQDKRHGKGRRVLNPMKDNKKHRCSVCGTVRD